jgi:hypothetical protein
VQSSHYACGRHKLWRIGVLLARSTALEGKDLHVSDRLFFGQ